MRGMKFERNTGQLTSFLAWNFVSVMSFQPNKKIGQMTRGAAYS